MQTATRAVPGADAEEARRKDYSLIGRDTALAIERGLAEADWYTSPVPKDVMRELLERKDGPAIRDTLLYFGLILASGYATYRLWGSWWALVPMMVYGVAVRVGVGRALARGGARHGLPHRLDEQRAVRGGVVHGAARVGPLALEPHSPPQRHHHRRP